MFFRLWDIFRALVDDVDMDSSDSSDCAFPSDANRNTKSKSAFNSDLQKVGVIKLNPL